MCRISFDVFRAIKLEFCTMLIRTSSLPIIMYSSTSSIAISKPYSMASADFPPVDCRGSTLGSASKAGALKRHISKKLNVHRLTFRCRFALFFYKYVIKEINDYGTCARFLDYIFKQIIFISYHRLYFVRISASKTVEGEYQK